MTTIQSAAPVPPQRIVESVSYERLGRVTGRHAWWRPIVGTFVLAGLCTVGIVLVYGGASSIAAALRIPMGPDELPEFGERTGFAVDLVVIASLTPAVALTVRWVQRRRLGSVSSVTGRLRRAWLGRCLVVAAVISGATVGVLELLSGLIDPDAPAYGPWVGWGPFVAGLVMLVCLAPLQAAAEEYVFRGWLLQAVGSYLRRPVVVPLLVVVPQAVLFAAAHGWGTPWGFADLLVFGVITGWLTIRTGGLEAAIALHVTNNLIAMLAASMFTGGLATGETSADLPWLAAVIDMALKVLFAVLVVRLADRYKPEVRS